MTILSTILTKLAAALASLSALLGLTHPAVTVSNAPVPIISSSTAATGANGIPAGILNNSKVSDKGVFTDKNWSLAFTLRPEWNVHELLDANNQLHQMQISSSKTVFFISKNEGIGLSGDLKYTTSTRTIAEKSVEVRTYANPSAGFAYYQLFTVSAAEGQYTFLIKNTSVDTSITDTFISSIITK
jgi:hypothetical protein